MRKKPAQPSPPPEPSNESSDQKIFTIDELSARWRVNRHTVEDAIKDGRLQAFKPNKRGYRVFEAEVLRYEQQHMGSAVAS